MTGLGLVERVLNSEDETVALASEVARRLRPGDVVGLEGGLGAGKTTFARGAIYELGVSEEIAVTSPTFALLHHYRGQFPIAHADFYRLEDEAELEELGLDELADDGAILFIGVGAKVCLGPRTRFRMGRFGSGLRRSASRPGRLRTLIVRPYRRWLQPDKPSGKPARTPSVNRPSCPAATILKASFS